MTREEAIKYLNGIKAENLNIDVMYINDRYCALKTAIKSLDAWDKVIEEIEGQRDFNIECDGESDLGMAIQIIKKHLGE